MQGNDLAVYCHQAKSLLTTNVWTIDSEIFTRAAYLKAHWRKIALADCFAMAFAHRIRGILVTSDHGEFDPLVTDGEKSIEFWLFGNSHGKRL